MTWLTTWPGATLPAEHEGLAELKAAIKAGLRKCRVEDAPISLIHEADLFHVTHMVADALADLLAARDRRVRAEAWDEGNEAFARSFLKPLGENGMRDMEPNPYREADA